jgi:hypothetical protein
VWHGAPKSVEELERHRCIRFISPSSGRTVDWRCRRGGEEILEISDRAGTPNAGPRA